MLPAYKNPFLKNEKEIARISFPFAVAKQSAYQNILRLILFLQDSHGMPPMPGLFPLKK
jgi:hypothetical protein